MINKKSAPRLHRIVRPGGRVPKLCPAAMPGWYKRLRRLISIEDKKDIRH